MTTRTGHMSYQQGHFGGSPLNFLSAEKFKYITQLGLIVSHQLHQEADIFTEFSDTKETDLATYVTSETQWYS